MPTTPISETASMSWATGSVSHHACLGGRRRTRSTFSTSADSPTVRGWWISSRRWRSSRAPAPQRASCSSAAADVLVVPSRYEPLGMVVLEGMSQGLAVVVTDAGGPAEIVDHGVTGLVVAPRRPADLARRSWISAATRSCGCGSDEPRAGSWPSGTRAGRWYARWKRSATRHAGRETSDERQRRGCSMRRNTFSVSRWSDGRTLSCAPSLLPPGASAHAQSIVPVAQTSAPERAR